MEVYVRDYDIITVLTFICYHHHIAWCELELGHFLSKVWLIVSDLWRLQGKVYKNNAELCTVSITMSTRFQVHYLSRFLFYFKRGRKRDGAEMISVLFCLPQKNKQQWAAQIQ